ncbi:MAG: hypothetical protein K8F30_06200, partial [Taibaiella sp.]|nr:hypothetical protein [Taibaiella sp.]
MIIALLPMGGMVVIAFVYLIVGRASGGAIVLPMIMMVGLSAISGVVGFSLQRDQQRKTAIEQRLDYERHIDRRLARVQAGIDLQRDLLSHEYPSVTELIDLSRNRSTRLWTRRPNNNDFGAVRLGLGAVPSKVLLRLPDPDGNAPGLRWAIDEGFAFQSIQDAPIVLTLGNPGIFGIIGERSVCVPLLYGLIAQLAVFQAPDVLQLYLISSKSEYATWQWMRWLPHTSVDGNGGFPTNLAFDEQTVRHLLLYLSTLLDNFNIDDAGVKDAPHILHVLIVENLALVRDDPTFLRLLTHSGVTALCLTDTLGQTLGDSRGVLTVKRNEFTLQLVNEVEKPWTGNLEIFSRSQAEVLARSLARLRLPEQTGNNRIPNSVNLLELFDQAPNVETLGIEQRWYQAPTKAATVRLPFPVPIGRRSFSDTLWLDLSDSEDAHGPHLELGGTTGYGKSVLLETYVIAMAIEHPPQFLNFMLFDFKGGNTFELFRHLPHTVGMITNLDSSSGGSAEIEAQRALIALSAERRRRETMLRGYKDIHDYYRQTLVEPNILVKDWEALPFLVIIVDEFAELLQQMPAFLKELVSTVRLGRSSGMHLILATQNPAADVSSDIRSNLKSHILLRVNAETDSQTVIKTPQAARINKKGRALIQSGNEIAIEFQSASSRVLY